MWACDPALTSTIVDSFQGAGPLFVQALQTFMAAHCALVGDHLWPADATEAVFRDPYYDFIVVGSGSSGSVVANRLSEVQNWKVLLVEAGGNPTLATEVPMLFYNNIGITEDWGYLPEPQEKASRAFKQGQGAWPRGKVLGGCSSINAMYYVRGNKADYDEWAADGNYGWSYDEVLPYFKKSENFSETLTDENEKYHSKGGYLNVQRIKEAHIIEQIFLNGLSEIGLKTIDDVNGPNQIGALTTFTTIKDGIRQSTARAFLSPIRNRTNLHVIKNALATKILFEPNSNKVKGVVLRKNNNDIIVNVKKEIIVSAGAINTPQLLLLSGIGPKQHLNDLNIKIKADLPVGENLLDHLFVPVFFTMPADTNINSLSYIVSMLTDYLLTNKGPYSEIVSHRVIAFTNTTDITVSTPDIQYHFIFFPPKCYNFIDIMTKHRLSDKICKEFREINENKSVLFIYTTLLRPKSKGRITLRSADPNDPPVIHPNYFTDIEDLNTIVRGMKFASRLNDTESFKRAGLQLHWFEHDDCKKYEQTSDDYIACVAKEMTFTLYHPSGTAKMGPGDDTSAVLDPELRVKNVKGLRVIDTSIMPKIVRGNTNAPAIMIGEKGADMIKKFWENLHTEL
ncbi:glucose dehydrogenase [FAD, quinone]-like [Epargyreus clarus]|uniref:glucose dehydrogenase [FAD, quinone]-like n=1 Tax=Epargyreus clarus TaxID=520877 RepID=UPI003C2EF359